MWNVGLLYLLLILVSFALPAVLAASLMCLIRKEKPSGRRLFLGAIPGFVLLPPTALTLLFFLFSEDFWLALPCFLLLAAEVFLTSKAWKVHWVIVSLICGAYTPAALFIASELLPHSDSNVIRMRGTKSNGEMRAIATRFAEYEMREGSLPLPVNSAGEELSTVTLGSASQTFAFRGPSFVPAGFAEDSSEERVYRDSFSEEGREPYTYGAGPIEGATVAFILTGRGPDGLSEAEYLEQAFLLRQRADEETFKTSPDSLQYLYSPTNGTNSPGDLARPVRLYRPRLEAIHH